MKPVRIILTLVLVVAAVAVWVFTRRAPEPPGEPQPSALAATSKPSRIIRPAGAPLEIKAPLGLPPVPLPGDNPPTAETVALGRRLYYAPALSVDNTVACATCHHPKFGFTDGQQFSEGVKKQKGGRNAPTVINAAYYSLQFWDGRAPSLEKQAEGPVQNPMEMAHTLEGVEQKLTADPAYVAQFETAFGPGPITYEMVERAIATFERTIISGNSPFDRYFYGGDKRALSESARRGLEVFRDPKRGNCTACHTVGEKHALFTDNKFHNIGVGVKNFQVTDPGRYAVTRNEADRGAFKTPTLRNIAQTGPYMHDGSLKTLKDVVDFYVGGGNSNPHLDKEIHALDFLTGQDRKDLVAFLETLTGEMPRDVGPPQGSPRARSGK